MKSNERNAAVCCAALAALMIVMGGGASKSFTTFGTFAAEAEEPLKSTVGGEIQSLTGGTAGIGRETEKGTAPLLYGIGSTSKVVTAAAVMKLSEDGKLNLDEKLTAYIPEFEMADDRYKEITPRMLLDHTSGMQGSTLNDAMLLGDNDTKNHDELLSRLRSQRLKAEPGAFGVYCNDGFTLAEILVERVSGMSFTDYLEKEFAKKLELNQLKTPQSPGIEGNLAKIYDEETGSELPPENANVIGSGGIYATAMDLCRFSELFMKDRADNARLLSDESLAAMETSRYQEELNPEGVAATLSYGLGWDSVETYPFSQYGIKALVKGGDTNFYHASLTVLPQENISCAVLSSGGSSMLDQLAVQEILMTYLDEVERIEREDEESVPKAPENAAPVPEELLNRSGWYAGNDMFSVKVSQEEELLLTSKGTGKEIEQTYRCGSDGAFYSTNGNYINSQGELTKGSNGRIGRTRLHFPEENSGYLMAETMETYPGMGRTVNFLPVAERYLSNDNEQPEKVIASWSRAVEKEYYLVSDKYTSSAYLRRFMVKPILLSEPKGILSFEDRDLTMAEITDELHARFFTKVPGQAGRDLNDYALAEEDSVHYLNSGSYRYILSEDVGALPVQDCTVTVGADGETIWFRVGEDNQKMAVSIETPSDGAWYVYDHIGREMNCVSSSWTLENGRAFYLPEEGRVAFSGEPGAEFKVHYTE